MCAFEQEPSHQTSTKLLEFSHFWEEMFDLYGREEEEKNICPGTPDVNVVDLFM